ncbi:TonB-dependent siderophore receptor [Sphingomonas sp. G124]|uniref:TonB-dependent siderophore receptor n=1 Tax=Sphingomonas cremea TaxID=2904799 RepID=A0A9X1U648_9SPHN|nr:TonB-dependent siderophore receptor [Sphingomonas cremea]MCF2515801.1 TonB-dependent siderophore receptor [Sphingomonas cremea]
MFRVCVAALLATTALAAPALAADVVSDAVEFAELGDPIVVIGDRGGYDAKDTSTATKTDTPLQDIPQAISVITSQQIADQGMVSIADVLRTVPGATAASGEGHRDQVLLRGQNTTADFFVDGIRDDVQYYRGLYNLDRVEVLKGPNAMIFGRGGGGGIINRVTKKALNSTFAAGSLAVDSHGAWGIEADLNMPIGHGLSGRFNGAYENFNSFRDHVDGHRIGLNPTLGWENDITRVDLSYEYSHDRRVVDRGIPSDIRGRGPATVDDPAHPLRGAQDQFFGDPDVNRLKFDAHVFDLAIKHRFSDRLQWTGKARVGDYDKFYRNAMAATPVVNGDLFRMEAYQSKTNRNAVLIQNDLVAEASTGPVDHTLLAGVDFASQDTFADRQQGFFDDSPLAQTENSRRRLIVSLANSDSLPPITFRDDPSQPATAADTDARSWGVYIQDQAKLGDHVELIAGLRRDWFKLDFHNRINDDRLSRKDSKWSPRLGVVLKPVETLSIYGSWSKSFLPQSGDQFSSLTATTAALAPEKFVNREVGLKWAALPGLDVTLTAYILDRTNTRATDPVTQQTVLTGEERSKGIEASAVGKLTDRLSIAAAAALQKAEITKTTAAAAEGRDVASVPHFTASLWGRYEVNDRLGLGLGIYHQSKMFASISNAVVVPGFTRLDAAGYIGITDQVALQLNVENLLDKHYIGLVHTDNNLNPGAPRTARATLRFKI